MCAVEDSLCMHDILVLLVEALEDRSFTNKKSINHCGMINLELLCYRCISIFWNP